MAGYRYAKIKKIAPRFRRGGYRKKFGGYAKSAYKRYGTRWSKMDRFATLSNSPSPSPASLRPGQGSYSRAAFARAAVTTDLEIKNVDCDNGAAAWSTMAPTPVASASPLSAGAYVSPAGSINLISAGSSANQREGRKVVAKGIESRFTFQLSSTTTAANTTAVVRLITVLDRQANGASFATTDLFEVVTPLSETNAVYNIANSQRFKILGDETFDLNAQSNVGAGGASVAPTKSKVVKMVINVPIEYGADASPAVLSQVRSNNILHALLIQGAGTVAVTSTTRLYFVG